MNLFNYWQILILSRAQHRTNIYIIQGPNSGQILILSRAQLRTEINIIQGPTQEKYRYYPWPNSGQIKILSRPQLMTNMNIMQGPTRLDQYEYYLSNFWSNSAQFGSRLEFLSYSLETLHAGAETLQDLDKYKYYPEPNSWQI